jgi:glycosyltransferase involved in cell wall biosynthesis
MKLSAIVLCYNFGKYIEQALLSLLQQQTDFDFEVLVRDDFSQDNSAEIIERLVNLYPKLRFVRGKENIGFAKSYEELLNLAEGEYIAYLDGDDYLINQSSFQRHVNFLSNNPTYIMTCAGYWEKDAEENYAPPTPVNWLCPRIHDGEFNISTEHYFQMNPSHFNRVYRKIPNTFFDYMYNLPMLDWPLNFELSLRGKVKYLNFPAGVYRRHETSLMNTIKGKDVGNIIIETIKTRKENYIKENGN